MISILPSRKKPVLLQGASLLFMMILNGENINFNNVCIVKFKGRIHLMEGLWLSTKGYINFNIRFPPPFVRLPYPWLIMVNF